MNFCSLHFNFAKGTKLALFRVVPTYIGDHKKRIPEICIRGEQPWITSFVSNQGVKSSFLPNKCPKRDKIGFKCYFSSLGR